MNSVNVAQYATQTSGEPNTEIYILLSLILFGAVIWFVGKMIYNFVQAYKTGTPDFKEQRELEKIRKEEELENAIKAKYTENEKICVYCGQKNSIDSKFCNECGKRMP